MYLSNRQIETISGLCAGFSTTVITHPLDLIKIRLQLSSGPVTHPFKLFQDVIYKINRSAEVEYQSQKRLPRAYFTLHQYYRGITPNIIGNISAWSLYFTLYAEFKTHLSGLSLLNTVNYFASSTLAGVSTSLLTNPIWVLKTRILGSSSLDKGAYKSVADGIKQILVNEGPKSFWKGTIPSMFLVFQGSLQFTFYDHLKAWSTARNGNENGGRLATGQYIYISAVSKILSMVIMYPSQMIKARLQNNHGKGRILDVCKEIWNNEGNLRGFYKGVSANILRVVPATCITFVVYESMKDYLQQFKLTNFNV